MDIAGRPMQVHPVAPELTQRYAALHQNLQPSARSWVEEQAHIESKNPKPDLAALENQVRARFATSLAKGKSSGAKTIMSGTQVQAGQDIEAMTFVVLMQAVNNSDQDLQQIMNETKAISGAKDRLRAAAQQAGRESASVNGATAKQPCRVQICQTLPGELREISASTAQTRHPVRLSPPANLTNGQLQQTVAQMNRELNSLTDLSQQLQFQLQTAMDQRSQLEQMASNVMKKQQDTSNSILSNMK